MTSIESLTGKAIMATDPRERQWYEDQITINLYARRLLCGNSSVVVVDGGDDGTQGYVGLDVERVREICDARGWRIIIGSELYTPSDRPRKYRAAETEV